MSIRANWLSSTDAWSQALLPATPLMVSYVSVPSIIGILNPREFMGSRSAQAASSGMFSGPPYIIIPNETSTTAFLRYMGPALQNPSLIHPSLYSPRRNAESTWRDRESWLRLPAHMTAHHAWSSVAADPITMPAPAYPRPTANIAEAMGPSWTILAAGTPTASRS